MNRVMIIGNAGGGKSRLAWHLSKCHHLPLTEIDRIRWRPGWVRVPEDEFTATHHALISGAAWVIDGWGSWESVRERLAAGADLVQGYTAFIYRGPFWARQINRGLAAAL